MERQGPAHHKVESRHRAVTRVFATEGDCHELSRYAIYGDRILELKGRFDCRAVKVRAVGDQLRGWVATEEIGPIEALADSSYPRVSRSETSSPAAPGRSPQPGSIINCLVWKSAAI